MQSAMPTAAEKAEASAINTARLDTA